MYYGCSAWHRSPVCNIQMTVRSGTIETIFIVLSTDTYIEYISQLGGEELAIQRHGRGFFESAKRDAMTRIHEEDRETFLKWFSRENVLREIDAQGVFTITYRLIDSGTPQYASMKINRMQGRNRLILGVSIIDAQMKQQEEEKKLRQERVLLGRIAALAGNFIALFIVDPVTEHFLKYSSSENLRGLASRSMERHSLTGSTQTAGMPFIRKTGSGFGVFSPGTMCCVKSGSTGCLFSTTGC